MNHLAHRLWAEQDGVLSFEWTLLVTLLVIGVVGGVAASRDAIVDELGDAAQAMLALDHSYELDSPLRLEVDIDGLDGPEPAVVAGASAGAQFIDSQRFADCERSTDANVTGQELADGALLDDVDS